MLPAIQHCSRDSLLAVQEYTKSLIPSDIKTISRCIVQVFNHATKVDFHFRVLASFPLIRHSHFQTNIYVNIYSTQHWKGKMKECHFSKSLQVECVQENHSVSDKNFQYVQIHHKVDSTLIPQYG